MAKKKKAQFAMALHCFQPVFNPAWEMEYAYEHSYLPFVKTLEEFPLIKATIHFSGNMIEWFEKKHPEYITLVKSLLERGQVELIGGGYFEPVMALIPERDRKEQLKMNSNIVKRVFSTKPTGAWMTERVWLPELAETLSGEGIKYTILDDHHFTSSGMKEEEIYRPYSVLQGEEKVVLFPSSTKLRYMIPFSSAHKVMDYMKEVFEASDSEEVNFFFADDMEKFGSWPHTHKHVYRRRWLKKFFSLLEESSDWLATCTFGEVALSSRPVSLRHLPESMYPEMDSWSGGSFTNFLDKYPEARRMHNRMMSVSDKVESSQESMAKKEAQKTREELFKAQTSCPYWHGTFGGVYLPHLREGVYRHLLNAEKGLDELNSSGKDKVTIAEVDFPSGGTETVLDSEKLKVFTSSRGGKLTEIDLKKRGINLINTITRKEEEYHKKLDKGHFRVMKKARKAFLSGELADVHDLLGVKERGLKRSLSYDTYEKSAFLTHIFEGKKEFLEKDFTGKSLLSGVFSSSVETEGDVISLLLARRERTKKGLDLEVKKRITLGEGEAVHLTHEVVKHSETEAGIYYAVEFNFLVRDREAEKRIRKFKSDHFTLKDRFSDMEVDFFMDRPFDILKYPLYSINETESGLGRTFQGVCVVIGSECACKDEMDITIALR